MAFPIDILRLSMALSLKIKKYRISTKYFVRNLKENYKTDLNILEKDKSTKKHINKLRFQRFYFKSIDAKDLYKSCFKLLKKNKYSLVSK